MAPSAVMVLALLGGQLGVNLDARALLRSHPFEGDEPSNATLISMATANGLKVEPIKLRRGDLARLIKAVPAMLRFRDGRSLILVRTDKVDGEDVALLRDPFGSEDAIAAISEDRLFETWDGDVLLVKRHWRVSSEDQPFGFGWLIGQVLREKKVFRDIAISAIISAFFSMAPPLIVMMMVDRVISHHSFQTLKIIFIALGFVIFFDTLLGYLRRYMVEVVTSRIDARINIYVFTKLLNLPISFFETNTTGRISSKVNEIFRIRQFLTGQLLKTAIDGVSLFVLVPVLFWLNWKLAFLVVTICGIIMLTYGLFLPALRRQYSRVVSAEQELGSHQVETIHGIRTVKSLALDGRKRRERDARVARAIEERLKLGRLANIPETIVQPFERFIYAGSMTLACYMILSGDAESFSTGSIMGFGMMANRASHPLIAFAGLLQSFEEARGAVGQVASVINQPPERGRSPTSLRLPISGAISFHDVRFRYAPEAPYALEKVSFDIPKGTIFGVMGRSGSGKTTITRLLQGLHYEFDGLIKIDGMDLREIDLDHLRSNVGVVLQENFLFKGTIRENISAANPTARFDMITRAAQLAGAEEFIERFPRGYETEIEEGAVNLSGGQRQRLAIARALLIDPPILILDEATSALDAESEAIVNANLMRIAADRTLIIISHRLSSLIDANQILVLERGKVYDIGTHEVLLSRCDIYKQLWYQQNRHLQPDGPHVRIAFP